MKVYLRFKLSLFTNYDKAFGVLRSSPIYSLNYLEPLELAFARGNGSDLSFRYIGSACLKAKVYILSFLAPGAKIRQYLSTFVDFYYYGKLIII